MKNSKYDKLYDNMINNVRKGISNKKNYRIIEKILEQRNKELRDLYLQGDYIVKPEYLEWQILFSGYYKETNKGDNTAENAKYHSDPLYGQEGYYDENGDYIITKNGKNGVSGKPLQPNQDIREVELGIRIPIKGTSRNPLNLNIEQPKMDDIITASGINVTEPTVTIPSISVPTFTPVTVSVAPVSIVGVTTYSFKFPGSGNGDGQWIVSSGATASLHQQNFNYGKTTNSSPIGSTSTGTPVGSWKSYDGRKGKMEIIENSNDTTRNFNFSVRDIYMEGISGAHSLTFNDYQSFDFINQSSTHAVMKLVGEQDVYINNTNISYWGRGLKSSTTNFLMLFHTDAHNEPTYLQDSRWIIGSDTEITLGGEKTIFYGVQSHSTRNSGSGMENSGKITTTNNGIYTTKYVDGTGSRTGTASGGVVYSVTTPGQRIIFTTIDDSSDNGAAAKYSRNFYFINNANGEIRLNGTGDLLASFATPGNTTKYGTFIQNDGIISINGQNSTGVVTAKSMAGINNYGGSKIVFNKAVDLLGDSTIGAVLQHKTFNLALSNINLNIGNGTNVTDSSGNSVGNDAELVENAIGLFFDNNIDMILVAGDGTGAYTTAGIQNVLLGENAKSSTLFRIDGGNLLLQGTMKLDHNTITTSSGNKSGNNIGIVATNTGTATLDSTGTILVNNGDNNSAAYTQDGGTVINNGTIKITGTNTNGVVTGYKTTAGNITNNGVIEKSNNGAAVVLAGGNFTNGANGIIITKDGSAGIYSCSWH